ncbi:MAG: hypothetical protein AAB477_02285 [Patescibacteria group bacterium]
MKKNTTKRFVLINKSLLPGDITEIDEYCVGKVTIISATRRDMAETVDRLRGIILASKLIWSDNLDVDAATVSFDSPGFTEVMEVEADTVIVICSSAFLSNMVFVIERERGVKIGLHVTQRNEALGIDLANPDQPKAEYIIKNPK